MGDEGVESVEREGEERREEKCTLETLLVWCRCTRSKVGGPTLRRRLPKFVIEFLENLHETDDARFPLHTVMMNFEERMGHFWEQMK